MTVEKRIADRSPDLGDVSSEMDYLVKKSGALRLCVVKLPMQAGDLFVSAFVVHLVVPLRSVRRRSFDVVDHEQRRAVGASQSGVINNGRCSTCDSVAANCAIGCVPKVTFPGTHLPP